MRTGTTGGRWEGVTRQTHQVGIGVAQSRATILASTLALGMTALAMKAQSVALRQLDRAVTRVTSYQKGGFRMKSAPHLF